MPFLLAILLLAAPLYVWRFSINILGVEFPTNFLMLFVFAVIVIAKFIAWDRHSYSVLGTWKSYFKDMQGLDRMLGLGIILIVLGSIISLFAFGIDSSKLGQWIVLYLEPISIFLLIHYFAPLNKDPKYNVQRYASLAAYWLLLAAGVVAMIQYQTLLTLPMDWWGNASEPKRAIAFFAHPNAYALFATPLLAWLLPDVVRRAQALWATARRVAKARDRFWLHLICVVAWLVGGLGLFLTLSRGAWFGLLVAAGLYVLLSANKKLMLFFAGAIVVLAMVVAAVPNLRYRVILPFYGEKSAVARLSLWDTGSKMLTDSPQSLLLGKGINGFSDNWDKFNTDPNLDHYNFPHNIFLNFWIDLGLLGLLGFILVMLSAVWKGIKDRKNPLALGLLLFVAAIVAHGLIDIPYLKNDLALMFWMIYAVSLSPRPA